MIKRINEHNYSGNGASHEQMLRLLNAFTFYVIDFFGAFFNVKVRIITCNKNKKAKF